MSPNAAASTIPTKMRFPGFCPKEREEMQMETKIPSLNEPPKKSFERAKIRAKQGSTQIKKKKKMWPYIYWCVYI